MMAGTRRFWNNVSICRNSKPCLILQYVIYIYIYTWLRACFGRSQQQCFVSIVSCTIVLGTNLQEHSPWKVLPAAFLPGCGAIAHWPASRVPWVPPGELQPRCFWRFRELCHWSEHITWSAWVKAFAAPLLYMFGSRQEVNSPYFRNSTAGDTFDLLLIIAHLR